MGIETTGEPGSIRERNFFPVRIVEEDEVGMRIVDGVRRVWADRDGLWLAVVACVSPK